MNDPRTLMIGVDFAPEGDLTEGCRTAADTALKIVKDTGAKVVLVHSIIRDQYWNPLKRGLVIVSEGLSETGRATVAALADEIKAAGGKCETLYTEDKPFLSIARESQRHKVDLVIVGKHSRRENNPRKLGNVAKRILHYCACPVLVVSAQRDPKARRVLAATDLTAVGGAAVDAAAWFARRDDAELHVVHAYQFSMEDQIDPRGEEKGAYESRQDELRRSAQDVVASQLEGTGYEESATVYVSCGAPDTLVLKAVETLKPDLVVMGTISRGGIAGLLTGNTAERLLDRIPTSILAVKPRDFVSPVKV